VLKLIVEILMAIVLHPLAYILCIINIVTRKDLGGGWKVLWILITFFWGIGPILYVLFGGGEFW
jgi:phospholipase D-like protein